MWPSHVGIYGQWIDTWCPPPTTDEAALILEEDIIVSPYAWRWLKSVRKAFGQRQDVAGYTLQSEMLLSSVTGKPLKTVEQHMAFAYRVIGTWGFSPHPRRWAEFRNWFYWIKQTYSNISVNGTLLSFRPYVDGIVMTKWYKLFESAGKQDTMWSMWFIYYTDARKLYTIYNNINQSFKRNFNFLAVHNNIFGGLHYAPQNKNRVGKLLTSLNAKLLKNWHAKYSNFSTGMLKFEYDGKSSTF